MMSVDGSPARLESEVFSFHVLGHAARDAKLASWLMMLNSACFHVGAMAEGGWSKILDGRTVSCAFILCGPLLSAAS